MRSATSFLAAALPLALAEINWGACPAGQDGNECASIPLPMDPDDPNNNATVSAFVRRFYAGSAPTDKSLWMFAGGPGDTAESFAGGAEYFTSYDPSVTVYLMDQRGVGMSTPTVNCALPPLYNFDPGNQTTIDSYSACNAEIAEIFGPTLKYFGTYYAAVDYVAVVNMVGADKVAIYALSFGTYALNMYLQIPGARADVVILDGPVPPNKWALERDPEWKSIVAQDILRDCAALSATCGAVLDARGHEAALLHDAVVDGTLPCLAQLPWLTPYTAATYNTGLVQGLPSNVALGPFWARVGRCSASDVEQLNFFHAVKQAAEPSGQAPPFYTYGLSVTIGANEVFSFAEAPAAAPSAYADLAVSSPKAFATGGVELLIAHARDVDGFPTYAPDARTYKKFAAPTMPLRVLVGTMDPQTPFGLGPWFVHGLGLPASALVPVPWATHGTVGPDNMCVLNMATDYLCGFGERPMNTSCLADLPPPDFEGTGADAQQLAMAMFGTTDLWNGMQAR